MRWILIVALLIGGPAMAEQTGRIMVVGDGSVTTTPDMAIVRMGVSAEAATSQEAMAQVSATMTRVQEVLTAAGIAARDIQTTSLQLHPRWDNRPRNDGEPPAVVGYNAQNSIAVTVRDLASVGDVVGAVTADGANQFHGISFAVADPAPLRNEARRAAAADARAKAMLYAEAAGVELGPLIELREEAVGMPGPVPMQMQMHDQMRTASDAFSAPVAEGELVIREQLLVIYATQ